MKKDAFLSILSQNSALSEDQTNELENLVNAYPFFQAARAMQLKGIKTHFSFSYNQALKKTAAYTTDRSVLFDFITSKEFNQQKIAEQVTNNQLEEEKYAENEIKMKASEADKILDPGLFSSAEKETKGKDGLEIGAALNFDKKEEHSFTQWLQLTKARPLNSKEETTKTAISTTKKTKQFDLIDNFIANNPKIKPSKEKTFSGIPSKKTQPSNELMTETLARVYLEQKNYDKAIQAYNILILKNPEKSGLFADQIRAIKKLQENKNQ